MKEKEIIEDLASLGIVSEMTGGVHWGWGESLSVVPKLREDFYLTQEGLELLIGYMNIATGDINENAFYMMYLDDSYMDNRDSRYIKEVALPSHLCENRGTSIGGHQLSLKRVDTKTGTLYMLCSEDEERGFGYSDPDSEWVKKDKFLMSPRKILQFQGNFAKKINRISI